MIRRAPSQPNAIVRLFSSVWFGVILLALIVIYASFGSALPQLRGALEMTEMQVFRHWLFVLLLLLFSITLTVTTIRRIRWNLTNLGVLVVHSGLLMLVGGAYWYFSTKIEGDVLLLSPRVELLAGMGGSPRPVADVLAQPSESWGQQMPAFGGLVAFIVDNVAAGPDEPVTSATVRAIAGNQSKLLTLAANAEPVEFAPGLKLRLRTFPPSRDFYDHERPTLYFRPSGGSALRAAPIEGLPIHRERYAMDDGVLLDSSGHEYPSHRSRPEIRFGSFAIPTGWFEPWRLPITLDMADAPFAATVTGYLPYVASFSPKLQHGGQPGNPGIAIRLSAGDQSVERTLLAKDPGQSLIASVTPIEYRWCDSAAEMQDLLRPLSGPHELEIIVHDPPVQQRVVITEGQEIAVPGTPYKLSVESLIAAWPLVSPGFEDAVSPVARINVSRDGVSFNRTVIERFPQLSQDIDADGKRKRDGLLDPNIELRYRSSPSGKIMIVGSPSSGLQAGIFNSDGTVQRAAFQPAVPLAVSIGGQRARMTLVDQIDDARVAVEPTIETLEHRQSSIGRQASAIHVRLDGRGPLAGWSDSFWVPFSSYPNVEFDLQGGQNEGTRFITVDMPNGAGTWDFCYSRAARDLGGLLYPQKLKVDFFPGGRAAERWWSDFRAKPDGQSQAIPVQVGTNVSRTIGRWTLSQSGAAADHWGFTILGVCNRNGVYLQLLACILITLGSVYAFAVKPVLIRRRKNAALREWQQRSRAPESERSSPPRELVDLPS